MIYTVINHRVRKHLGISILQYCVADVIYNINAMQEIPFSFKITDRISEILDLPVSEINTICEELEKEGLLTDSYETTTKWYKNAIISHG